MINYIKNKLKNSYKQRSYYTLFYTFNDDTAAFVIMTIKK